MANAYCYWKQVERFISWKQGKNIQLELESNSSD